MRYNRFHRATNFLTPTLYTQELSDYAVNLKYEELPAEVVDRAKKILLHTMGAALAAACFLKILLVDRLLMGNESISLLVNGVVCLTLCVTVILAKFVGCTLPLFAKRLGFDPAVMASPFITTIVDALSLLVYFLFAKLLLGV